MSDSVQLIKDRLSILDVISPYVELHRAGKNFKGKSPFTAEKTPSFYVSPIVGCIEKPREHARAVLGGT